VEYVDTLLQLDAAVGLRQHSRGLVPAGASLVRQLLKSAPNIQMLESTKHKLERDLGLVPGERWKAGEEAYDDALQRLVNKKLLG
jgi:hypothetical protein